MELVHGIIPWLLNLGCYGLWATRWEYISFSFISRRASMAQLV
jgi:hypothetical protein